MPDTSPAGDTSQHDERKLFTFSAAARADACEAAAAAYGGAEVIRESAIAAVEALEPHVDAAIRRALAAAADRDTVIDAGFMSLPADVQAAITADAGRDTAGGGQ